MGCWLWSTFASSYTKLVFAPGTWWFLKVLCQLSFRLARIDLGRCHWWVCGLCSARRKVMSPTPSEVTLTKSWTGTGGYFPTSANPPPPKRCQEQLGAQLAPASTEPFPGLGPTELLQAARGLPRLIQICLVVYKHPIKHLGTRGPFSSRWCAGVPQLGLVSGFAVCLGEKKKKKKLILRNAPKGQFRNAHWSH